MPVIAYFCTDMAMEEAIAIMLVFNRMGLAQYLLEVEWNLLDNNAAALSKLVALFWDSNHVGNTVHRHSKKQGWHQDLKWLLLSFVRYMRAVTWLIEAYETALMMITLLHCQSFRLGDGISNCQYELATHESVPVRMTTVLYTYQLAGLLSQSAVPHTGESVDAKVVCHGCQHCFANVHSMQHIVFNHNAVSRSRTSITLPVYVCRCKCSDFSTADS